MKSKIGAPKDKNVKLFHGQRSDRTRGKVSRTVTKATVNVVVTPPPVEKVPAVVKITPKEPVIEKVPILPEPDTNKESKYPRRKITKKEENENETI